MKLVLQIAAGILLAGAIAVAAVGVFRWSAGSLAAAAQSRAETDASQQLRGLTPAEIRQRCGPVLEERDEPGLDGFRTLVFAAGSVTLNQVGDGAYAIDWVKTRDGSSAFSAAEKLRILPCLAAAK